MSVQNIKVIGMRPKGTSNVKPEGLHLRWSFPEQLGFPPGGFEIYRRDFKKVETIEEACGDARWQPRRKLLPALSTSELLSRLESGLKNRYARDRAQAESRYSGQLQDMLEWLAGLQDPAGSSLGFEDISAPPHLLRLKRDPKVPLQGVRPQSILLLAALDPNIARLLGLYWVDRFDEPGGPTKDTAYDFMVLGKWKNTSLCGVLFNLGANESEPPPAAAGLYGKQIDGYFWSGDGKPFGRVSLNWNSPASTAATRPVLFDVYRDGKALTEQAPILSPGRQAEINPAPCFIDGAVEILRDQPAHSYQIASIDLFGQTGSKSSEVKVEVNDLPAPPPPIRLQTWQPEPDGNPVRVLLQFEYGALQHLQAPNGAGFVLRRRTDTLAGSQRMKATVSQEQQVGGKLVYTLRLSNPRYPDGSPLSGTELLPIKGDVLTRVHVNPAKRLPAKERRQYRIAKVTGNPVEVRLDPVPFEDEHKLPPGGTMFDLLLTADPHHRDRWTVIPVTVNHRPPIVGRLTRMPGETLEVRIANVSSDPPSPDPFGVLQQITSLQGILPAGFPILPPPPNLFEVEIDRDLLDPDVFVAADSPENDFSRNGIATIPGGAAYPIAYVSSGGVGPDGRNKGAKLGLVGEPALSQGETLILKPRSERLPPASGNDQVRCLAVSGQVDANRLGIAGGEIILQSTRESDRPLVGQVVSGAANRAGFFDLLVRFPAGQSLSGLQINRQVVYYVPYRRALDFDITTATPASGLGLKIPDGKGMRSAYLTVSTRNDRGVEGPISLPISFTAVRRKPAGKPGPPYPCGMTQTAEAGYATPPDHQGRATIRLCWETGALSPATGLRFEVARALDTAIVATHLRNWQTGKVQSVDTALAADVSSANALLNRIPLEAGQPDPTKRGVVAVRFGPVAATLDPDRFRNGRLKDQNGACFQVTLVKRNGSNLDLFLRSATGSEPSVGGAMLEAAPDYTAALSDAGMLAELAGTEAQEAFGMATGVPIVTAEFLDEIPGKGRNRYLYRVHAVDAAGNTSGWSEVSAPFYTVDTTPPDPPQQFDVILGDRSATLVWQRGQDDPDVTYIVYRSTEVEEQFDQAIASPYIFLRRADLQPRRLVAVAGSLRVAQPIELRVPTGTSLQEIAQLIEQDIVVRELAGGPGAPNLYEAAASRAVFDVRPAENDTSRVRVTALSGLLPSPAESGLIVSLGQAVCDQDASAWAWTNTGLESGRMYTYRLAEVRAVPAGPSATARPQPRITVMGRATPPRTVEGLDRSRPPTPEIAARWVGAVSGEPVIGPAENALAEVTFGAEGSGALEMLLQVRVSGESSWQAVRSDAGAHWRVLPPATNGTITLRFTLGRSRTHELRLRLRTADGRFGDFSPISLLEALP
jgi:hypothetical protein